jgi:hypothetical protein
MRWERPPLKRFIAEGLIGGLVLSMSVRRRLQDESINYLMRETALIAFGASAGAPWEIAFSHAAATFWTFDLE